MSLTGRLCLYRRYCATAIQFSRPCHTNPTSDKGGYSPIVGEDAPPGIVRPPLPIITSRELQYPPKFLKPRQSWVENLDSVESKKLGLVDLHPEVFGAFPRLDILFANVQWQLKYNTVNWEFGRSRAEMPGGGRKPWPQKGLGKARAGSIRSPLFVRGGKTHGARGPVSRFYMLPYYTRIKGLTSALSAKFAQDDLKIVDSLEITSTDPKFLEDMFDHRDWGPAVLIVDDTDIMPKNITIATQGIKHVILMPVYGLNVFSMLKYHTLVLTVRALEKLEERILYAMNRLDHQEVNCSFKTFKHY